MPWSAPADEALTDAPASVGFTAPASELLNEEGRTPFQTAQSYLDAAGQHLSASLDRSGSWQEQAEAH